VLPQTLWNTCFYHVKTGAFPTVTEVISQQDNCYKEIPHRGSINTWPINLCFSEKKNCDTLNVIIKSHDRDLTWPHRLCSKSSYWGRGIWYVIMCQGAWGTLLHVHSSSHSANGNVLTYFNWSTHSNCCPWVDFNIKRTLALNGEWWTPRTAKHIWGGQYAPRCHLTCNTRGSVLLRRCKCNSFEVRSTVKVNNAVF